MELGKSWWQSARHRPTSTLEGSVILEIKIEQLICELSSTLTQKGSLKGLYKKQRRIFEKVPKLQKS